MATNSNAIVVGYCPTSGSFHRESVKEFTQGNALRLLRNHTPTYHAIAVVENADEAERVIAGFSRYLQVAKGTATPQFLAAHSTVPPVASLA